jgi:hypothetical protein
MERYIGGKQDDPVGNRQGLSTIERLREAGIAYYRPNRSDEPEVSSNPHGDNSRFDSNRGLNHKEFSFDEFIEFPLDTEAEKGIVYTGEIPSLRLGNLEPLFIYSPEESSAYPWRNGSLHDPLVDMSEDSRVGLLVTEGDLQKSVVYNRTPDPHNSKELPVRYLNFDGLTHLSYGCKLTLSEVMLKDDSRAKLTPKIFYDEADNVKAITKRNDTSEDKIVTMIGVDILDKGCAVEMSLSDRLFLEKGIVNVDNANIISPENALGIVRKAIVNSYSDYVKVELIVNFWNYDVLPGVVDSWESTGNALRDDEKSKLIIKKTKKRV